MTRLVWTYGVQLLLAGAAVLGFLGAGRLVRRRVFPALADAPGNQLAPAVDFGIGAAITWMAMWGLGLAGGYRHPWIAVLWLAATATAAAVQWLTERGRVVTIAKPWAGIPSSLFDRMLIAVCLACLVLALAGALTPPAAQDALVHHLATPKTYIRNGGVTELPYNYFSYHPAGMEMLYVFALLVAGPGMATLLHLSFALATVAVLLAASEFLGLQRRAGLIAATAFLTVPTVWMEMTWAYVDLALTFFTTLTIVAWLGFRRERRIQWLYVCGFAFGAALSIKYTALFLAPILVLLTLFLLRERRTLTPADVWLVIAPIGIGLLVACPWFIRNWYYTGNPLFPFLLDIIPSHNAGWDAERGRVVAAVLDRYGGEHKTLADYLLTPFKLSLLARYGSSLRYDGVIGCFFLFGLLLLATAKRVSADARYLLVFAGGFYVMWLLSAQHARYLLPILPALALAIASLEAVFATRWVRAIALAIFLANAGLILYYFQGFDYGRVFTGTIAPSDYLRRTFDYYRFYEYVNASTPPGSRIFLVVASNQPFYLERDFFSDSVFEDYTLRRVVADAQSPAGIRDALRARGLTHLLFRPAILFGPVTTPFDQAERRRFDAFLEQHGQLLMQDPHFVLYGIQ